MRYFTKIILSDIQTTSDTLAILFLQKKYKYHHNSSDTAYNDFLLAIIFTDRPLSLTSSSQ